MLSKGERRHNPPLQPTPPSAARLSGQPLGRLVMYLVWRQTMGPDSLRVIVKDVAGGRTVTAEVPANVPMSRLVPALVTKMLLPNNVEYGIQHKESGKQLLPSETLNTARVNEGDTLRLLPNVTAGCFAESTAITLADGSQRPLHEIESGKSILAYDFVEKVYREGVVEGVFRQTFSESVTINDSITMSDDQVVLLQDGIWKRAIDIKIGDILLKYPFGTLTVEKVDRQKGIATFASLALKDALCFVAGGIVAKDLIGKQVYVPRVVDVFLSYSTADRGLAEDIFNMLDKKGRTVFLAEKSIGPGEIWEKKIKESLRNCKSFWLLVSPHSLKSEWVITEWAAAWALDKPIVPILYRCQPSDLPRRIQDHQCVDFHQVGFLLETGGL